ncbi:MAG: hypothetical protein RLZZ540_1131 [Bacteroidota bacterium]|jgi:type I restriction enzyme S subunit
MKNKLPSSWIEVPFLDILDIQGGTQPPKSDFIYEEKQGYIKLLQIRDFGKKPVPTYIPISHKLKTCNEDDILIARYGASIGRIVTGQKGAYNVALAKVIIPENFNKRYFYYLLQSEIFQKTILSTRRSAQDGFNKNDLSEIILPIPPIAIQNKIADKMDLLFAKLNFINSKVSKIPDVMHYARDYVINSAATGNLTSDWRDNNPNIENAEILMEKIVNAKEAFKISDKSRKNLFRKINYENGTQDILPESWYWTNLLTIANVTGGITKGKKSNEDMITVPYLRVANVQDGFLNLSEIKTINASVNDFKKFKLEKGDILMTEGGDRDKLGRGTVWNNEIENCIHQNHIFRARVNQEFVTPDYITIFTKSLIATDYFFKNASQTVNLASISLKSLSNVPIALPPITEQIEIVKRVNNYYTLLELIDRRLVNLNKILHSLENRIYLMAFSGELIHNNSGLPITTDQINQLIKDRENIKKPITNKKTTNNRIMKTLPVKNFAEFVKCIEELGGEAMPETLLLLSNLEDNVDLFFELLREGRNNNLLEVPVGHDGLIKTIKR